MNRLASILCFATLFCCSNLSAQSLDYSGPISSSMGFVKVFDSSPWAGLNNVANLSARTRFAVAASYQMRFNMDELSSRAATLLAPTGLGNFAATIFQSGYAKSNYSRYGLSYSRLFGQKVAAGLQFNYLSHHIEAADNANTFYTGLGLNFNISEQWDVGVYIQNPEQASLEYEETLYQVPTFFNAACLWSPSSHFIMVAELEKQLEYDMVYKTGLQFNFKDKLFLRGGIKGQPVEMTFGGGVRLAGFSIDVGFAHHQQLGLTSGAGLSYSFNHKRP